MPEGFGLSTIGQVALTVRDLDRAVGFYRDRLGIRHLFTAPGMAFFDCGGVRLLLGLPQGNEPGPPGAVVYFKVAGLALLQGVATRPLPRRRPPNSEGFKWRRRESNSGLWLSMGLPSAHLGTSWVLAMAHESPSRAHIADNLA
jgi:catechol 2,3-dioxygenase-like lactoylglutathione lyase family enzyme